MKKFFLLLFVLSFLSANLYSQREVVIENFDSWGGENGCPTGFEGCAAADNAYWYGLVSQTEGYSVDAIKLTDLYCNNDMYCGRSYNISKTIDFVGKFPDSVKVRFKQSTPWPNEQRIILWFYNIDFTNDNVLWRRMLYQKSFYDVSGGDSINWGLSYIEGGGAPGQDINRIQIGLEGIRHSGSNYEWRIYDDITLVWNSTIHLLQPTLGEKWLSGDKETIRFSADDSTDILRIEYSTDGGAIYLLLADSIKASDREYEWLVPELEPTTKARIKITSLKTNDKAESENFRLKPYIITRLDNNGDYITYDIDVDRWKFGNTRVPNQVWPVWWWLRFNYQVNIDPFTNKPYSQRQGDSTFAKAHMSEFPDWISFVNTFSVGSCYKSTTLGIYSTIALTKWKAYNSAWGGSCFGLSNANALAFRKRNEFHVKYPDFPIFTDPINVNPDTNVIPVINELYTHTFGNPAYMNHDYNGGKSVNETLGEIKAMLWEDNTPIQTLYIRKNAVGEPAAHSILPYHLERDPNNSWLYYLWVYDNSYPNNTTAIITIDSSAYLGKGRWDPIYGLDNWGGEKWFYLEPLADAHLNYATIPKTANNQKLFMLPMGVEIDVTEKVDILITDSLGNSMGYQNNNLITEIPHALPLIYVNGSEGPPYGYLLGIRDYSIELNNFTSDTVETYFFTDNKAFSYERYDADEQQTDDLLFDGGIEVNNQDEAIKSIRLMNIVDGGDDERVFIFRGLHVSKDESIKITNPDAYNLDLISNGASKLYDVEINHALEFGLMRFNYKDVEISANSTHKLKPNWGDFAELKLEILVDEGNDGTIDDTLHLEDQGTGVEEHGSNSLPTKFHLDQNYPNPFNASTKIRYSIPEASYVTIKVFNILGEEVAELTNEVKEIGNHTVSFNASNLTSGIYFYRIQAGDFVETKKMVLMK